MSIPSDIPDLPDFFLNTGAGGPPPPSTVKATADNETISIMSYMNSVGGSQVEAQNVYREQLLENPVFFKQFYAAIGEFINGYVTTYTGITAVTRDLFIAKAAMQSEIDYYNNKALPVILAGMQNVNTAYTNYQNNPNPTTLAAYHAAATAYNNLTINVGINGGPAPTPLFAYVAYVNQKINTYNALMGTIPGINAIRTSSGLTPIAAGNQQTIPTLTFGIGIDTNPPPPTPFTAPSLPNVVSIPVNPPDVLKVSDALSYFIQLVLSQFSPNTGDATIIAAYNSLLQDINPNNPAIADSYVQTHLNDFYSGVYDLSPGVSATSITQSVGLSNNSMLLGALSKSLYDAMNYRAQFPENPDLIGGAQLLTLHGIQQSAILAGVKRAKSISETVVKGQTKAAIENSALHNALEFANSIHNLVSSNAVSEGIDKLIAGEPSFVGLSAEEKRELSIALTAIVNLTLTQAAVIQLSLAAHAPGAVAQTLANTTGAPPLGDLFRNPSVGLNNVLNNPVTILFIKEILATTLTSQFNLDESRAKTVVNTAISAVVAEGPYETEGDLQKSLLNAFQTAAATVQPPISPSVFTEVAANQTLHELRTQINFPFLNNLYPQKNDLESVQDFLRTKSTVGTVPTALTVAFPSGTVQRDNLNRLVNQVQGNPNILTAFNHTLAVQNTFGRIGDFRNQLVSQLTAQNIPADQANVIANQFTQLLAPRDSTAKNILHGQTSDGSLSRTELSGQLFEHVSAQLAAAVGPIHAREVAHQVVATNNRAVDDLNNQLSTLRSSNHQEVNVAFFQNIARVSQPSVPLYVQQQHIDHMINSEITAYMTPSAKDDMRKAVGPVGAQKFEGYGGLATPV